jgi:hypothetical protein
MSDPAGLHALELKYRRDHAAQMRGHFLRDALKKCITGFPSKPYEDLGAAKKRLDQINTIVKEALEGLP